MKKTPAALLLLLTLVFACKAGDRAFAPPKTTTARPDFSGVRRANAVAVGVAKRTMPGVVHIFALKENAKPAFLTILFSGVTFSNAIETWLRTRFTSTYTTFGTGSGFLINDRGYILTNNHVVSDADKVLVSFGDAEGTGEEAQKLGADPQSDVALIKISGDYRRTCLKLGDSDSLEVGEWVAAIGNPYDVGETFTSGVVSGLGRDEVGMLELEDFIQTDAAINPGNSGGPLINKFGEVVGINSIIFTDASNIGLAVPINIAKAILPQLVKGERVERGMIGVALGEITPELAPALGVPEGEGVVVTGVRDDSPARFAGIRPGDVITAFNGKKISGFHDLKRMAVSLPAGSTARVRLVRGGKILEITLKLSKLESKS